MWRYTSTPPYALVPFVITVIVLESGGVFVNIQLMRLCKMTLYYTVIPQLTKIIRSGITFVSRNVISRRFL